MGRSKQPISVLASKFFCSIPECGESFTKLANLRRHTQSVHEKDPSEQSLKYECGFEGCGKRFMKRKQLYDHQFQVHDDENKKYQCSKCPAKFLLQSKLKAHLKRHDGYQCPECQFHADTWSALRRHKAKDHPVKHKCHACGKDFGKPYELKKHQRVHHKVVKCPSGDCEEKLSPENIIAHVKANHADLVPDCRQIHHTDDMISSSPSDKPLECPDCGKKFSKARNARLHRRNVHEGGGGMEKTKRVASFTCPVEQCTKRFTTESKFRAHLNVHTGERPFLCPEDDCDAQFASRHGLQRHLKWKHFKTLNAHEAVAHLAQMCQDSTMEMNENTEVNVDVSDVVC